MNFGQDSHPYWGVLWTHFALISWTVSRTRSVVARRCFEVSWKVLILAPSMIGETSNFDLEVFRCARIRNFECTLNQSFAAGVSGPCSNLFLKADNFGNINNKCCFQAAKSLKCCRLKLCCWESIYPFSRQGHDHWNFSSQIGEPKISKNLRLEPLAENHEQIHNINRKSLTLHKFRPGALRSKSFD